jgi:hypothetical protein
MLHYAVSPEGQVFSYRKQQQARDAAAALKGHYGNDDSVAEIPTPMLIVLHNLIRPEKPVTRFSDRPTAEKRMQGVLEVLAKPGTPVEAPEQDPATLTSDTLPEALTSGEDITMATAAARKRTGAKKSATKKTTGAKRAAATEIPESEINRVAKMREDGKNWAEIMDALGRSVSWVHRIRPLLRKVNKSLVRNTGPGSPNYGKGKKTK